MSRSSRSRSSIATRRSRNTAFRSGGLTRILAQACRAALELVRLSITDQVDQGLRIVGDDDKDQRYRLGQRVSQEPIDRLHAPARNVSGWRQARVSPITNTPKRMLPASAGSTPRSGSTARALHNVTDTRHQGIGLLGGRTQRGPSARTGVGGAGTRGTPGSMHASTSMARTVFFLL